MGVLNFIKSKQFLIHLSLALLVVVTISWLLLKFLDAYTLHGETVLVPDLKGKTIDQMKSLIEEKGLKYEVVDSLFDLKIPKGAILDQNPNPNSLVKANRTVYLTVNAVLPPQIKMPNLLDLTYRQALAMIEMYGLKQGRLKYAPDIAKDAVLAQEFNGRNIQPGEMISKGSAVDLVLGQGEGGDLFEMPFLIGMRVSDAVSLLNAMKINVSIIPDNTVSDTALAKVYRQNPDFKSATGISSGSSMDIFTTQEYGKIAIDTLSN